jgi:4-amino-4-deoxy-L-arabinose transferase-like glycosyltransferase
VVLAVALVLRLVFFTGMVRGDALSYTHAAYYLSQGVFDLGAWEGMSRLGLYLPVAILFRLFGPSEFATLSFPMLSSLASGVFVYLIAKMFGGKSAGLIAAFIWTFLPLDIHLSTTLLPDGPMAALCTASVYFWFRARAGKNSIFYFASISLLTWAILVKPLAIVVGVFFAVTLSVRLWQGWQKKCWTLFAGKYLWIGAAVLAVGAFFYLQMQQLPFLVTLSRTGNDLGSFFFTGAAHLDFGDLDFSRSDLMIFVAPLFLVSFILLLRLRQGDIKPVLVWAAVLFIYYEWGTLSLNPLHYKPMQAFSEARYFLFMLAPLVILSGIFLARGLSDRLVRWIVPVIAGFTLLVGIIHKAALYTGGWAGWTAASSFLLVIGSIASPVLITEKSEKIRNGFTVLLLLVLSLSLLQPFLPYHALMYQDRLDQLNTFRLTLPFWNENKDYPICSTDPMSLNYASNFQLGFDWQGLSISELPPRIVSSTLGEKSCYVLTTQGQAAAPENWWPVKDFSSSQQTIYVYRVLSQMDAKRELSIASASLSQNRTIDNLKRFYGASVNSGSWADIFPAWIELHDLEPDKYTLDYLERLVTVYFENASPIVGENLFKNSDFSRGLADWNYPDPERLTLREDGGVSIRVGDKLVGLSQDVILKPNRIYFFTMTVATGLEMEVDILGIDQGAIPDSSSQALVADNPTNVTAIFVTPNWASPKNVNVQLFVPLGGGSVRLQLPALHEIDGFPK